MKKGGDRLWLPLIVLWVMGSTLCISYVRMTRRTSEMLMARDSSVNRSDHNALLSLTDMQTSSCSSFSGEHLLNTIQLSKRESGYANNSVSMITQNLHLNKIVTGKFMCYTMLLSIQITWQHARKLTNTIYQLRKMIMSRRF